MVSMLEFVVESENGFLWSLLSAHRKSKIPGCDWHIESATLWRVYRKILLSRQADTYVKWVIGNQNESAEVMKLLHVIQ